MFREGSVGSDDIVVRVGSEFEARSPKWTGEKKPRLNRRGFSHCNSLTMTYFHTGIRTIIGADSFHCPVRDGKEWDQVAMVVRLDWLVC